MKSDDLVQDMFFGAPAEIFELAKKLRMNPTPAEERLWYYISKKRMGFRFKRQHPIYLFIADFYCHKLKLIIEIDGDIHNLVDQKDYDKARSEEIAQLGISVIRFTNDQIFYNINYVLKKITDAISQILILQALSSNH